MTEIILLQTGSDNLFFGSLPEPLGLLIFGVLLVFIPIALRRISGDATSGETIE